MVCVADEVLIEVIQTFEHSRSSKTLNLSASTTIEELYNKVQDKINLKPDSFKLVLQTCCPFPEQVDLSKSRDMTLMQVEPNCLNQKTTIIIKEIEPTSEHFNQSPPIITCNTSEYLSLEEDDSYSRQMHSKRLMRKVYQKEVDFDDQSISNLPSIEPTEDFISNQPEKNYVGLVNQAMTCYLNSLLQALYMTPEFRNALYNWEYVDGKEKDEASSIPYQLQKLFLNLQTSTKPAVETTSLTKSFGWDSTEAWQQHDIQELCRVMFDALETKFKDTEQSDLINRLYEGKMIDYVKCLECKTEKTREDTFLDIPLPVRPFDSTSAYGSVEEALRAFVKYETLEGTNQYHCEKCNKKCDAHKGLKFTKFPYLLTLHLKRFDFDYNTLYRIKLNDKVTFPHHLDLNSLIETAPNHQESPCGEEDAGMSVKCDDSSTTDSGTLEDECPPCNGAISTNNHTNNHYQEDDEGIDMSNGHSTTNGIAHNDENEKNREKCLADRGPYMYELFSIMIHSGSASGGHYYAYIKDLETKQWLCFNDTTVNPITESDIQKVYGGGPSRAYSSSTNAYMLMYRQIDPDKNSLPMQEENFPQHIKALLQKMKETGDDDRRYHGRNSLTYKIKIYCHHPKTKKLLTNKLHAIGESTWGEQTERAFEKFGLHGEVDLENCRLVFYDHLNDLITHCYEGSDEDSIYDVFKGDNRSDLLLEIREKGQQFENYKPVGTAFKVYVVDVPKADIIDGPIVVRGYLAQPVKELKQQLSKIVQIEPNEMNLVLHTLSQFNLLRDDKTLDEEGVESDSVRKLFVSSKFDCELSMLTNSSINAMNDSPNSKLLTVLENFSSIIWLNFQLPELNKEIIEMTIPTVENVNKEESPKSTSNGLAEVAVNDASEGSCSNESSEKSSSDPQSHAKNIEIDNKFSAEGKKKTNDSSENNCIKWKAGLESTSEDSSLSDSEKTLVDESSYSYNKKKFDQYFNSCVNSDSEEESNYYFKGIPYSSEENEKMLKVLVDERMCLEVLKKKLEKFVGVPVHYFNIYAQPPDGPETQCMDLQTTLNLYNNGDRFCIKIGRALRREEMKVKLYQLHLDCPDDPFKFMFDWIVAKDMTVGQAKEEIIAELKRKYDLEIPFNRLRLRMRTFKSASTVLTNDLKFGDLTFSSQDELVVQELPEDETVVNPSQRALFVRRWVRSNLEFGPFQEVVLDGTSVTELKEKISVLSGIPEEHIDITPGRGRFPCKKMSVLDVELNLFWKHYEKDYKEIDKWPLDLQNDSVALYRDSREDVKKLTQEERREIKNKEKSQLMGLGTTPSYSSPRRERALKIYLDSK